MGQPPERQAVPDDSLRLCILNHTTTWDDVRETLETIERFGREVLAKDTA